MYIYNTWNTRLIADLIGHFDPKAICLLDYTIRKDYAAEIGQDATSYICSKLGSSRAYFALNVIEIFFKREMFLQSIDELLISGFDLLCLDKGEPDNVGFWGKDYKNQKVLKGLGVRAYLSAPSLTDVCAVYWNQDVAFNPSIFIP